MSGSVGKSAGRIVYLFKRKIMASVNKVILLGTLGRDPEVRFSANQLPIASLSLATSSF